MRNHRRQIKRKSQSQVPEEISSKGPKHHKANDIQSENNVSPESVLSAHHHCGVTMRETDENMLTTLDETQPPSENIVSNPFCSARDEEYRPAQPPSTVSFGNLPILIKNYGYDDTKNVEKSVNRTSSHSVSPDDGTVKSSSSKNNNCTKDSFEDHKVISNADSFINEIGQFHDSKDTVYHHKPFESSNQFLENSEEESDSLSILGVGTSHYLNESPQQSSDVNEKLSLKHVKCQTPLKQIDQLNVSEFGLNAFSQKEQNEMNNFIKKESGLVEESKIQENYDSFIHVQKNDTNVTVFPNVTNAPSNKLSTSEKIVTDNVLVYEQASANKKQDNSTWKGQRDTLEKSMNPRSMSTDETDNSSGGALPAERHDEPCVFGSKKIADGGMGNLKKDLYVIASEECKTSNTGSAICNVGIGKQGDNINFEEGPATLNQSASSSKAYHSEKDENLLSGKDKLTGKAGADKSCAATTGTVNDNLNNDAFIKGIQNPVCQENAFVNNDYNGENENSQSDVAISKIQYRYSIDRGFQLMPLSYNNERGTHNLSTSSEHNVMLLPIIKETTAETPCTNPKLTNSLQVFPFIDKTILHDKTVLADNELMTSSQGFDVSHIQKAEESVQKGNDILYQSKRKDTIPEGSQSPISQASNDDTMKALSEDNIADILNMSTQHYINHNNELIRDEEKNCQAVSADKDQLLFDEKKVTINNDQSDAKLTDNNSPEKVSSDLEPSTNYDLLMNDISDSQLCEASRQTEMEQKWDQNHLRALSEVDKQKQLGHSCINSILRELKCINRQVLKFKREMEILKYKMSSNAAAGQVNLPKVCPSSTGQNHRTNNIIQFPGTSHSWLKEP